MIKGNLDKISPCPLKYPTSSGVIMKFSGWTILLLSCVTVTTLPGLVLGAETWDGNLEFSYLETSGNSETRTLAGAGKAKRTFRFTKITGEAKGLYGNSEGTTTEQSWWTSLKAERNLTDRSSVFLLETAERDTLKGIELRNTHQSGLSYYFIQNSSYTLKGEAGAGYVQENPVDPFPNRGFPTARLFAEYGHSFAEDTRFEQMAEYLPSLKERRDYLIREESSLTTHLVASFALRLSFAITYDNFPPLNFEKTDRLFLTSLLYTF